MAARATRALEALDRAGVEYRLHAYQVDEKVGEGYGEAVAAAIGMAGDRVFKTLVAEVDGEAVVAVIPVTRRLSVKRLAAAAGGTQCLLAAPARAERVTGFATGGISPFGQRRRLRVFLDSSAMSFQTVTVSGGRRGIQVEVSPEAILSLTEGKTAPIAED
jgi:Cys-tRNA(Pro)/Cys-tRNA(Cys) deacylase